MINVIDFDNGVCYSSPRILVANHTLNTTMHLK